MGELDKFTGKGDAPSSSQKRDNRPNANTRGGAKGQEQ
jgi:hypothetical protein